MYSHKTFCGSVSTTWNISKIIQGILTTCSTFLCFKQLYLFIPDLSFGMLKGYPINKTIFCRKVDLDI